MSGAQMETKLERPRAMPDAAAAAARYLTRTGNADLLPILGLVADPIAEERGQAKAAAMLNHKSAPPPRAPERDGYCPICNNKLPGHGVCRRSNRCREAARKRGEVA